MVTNVNPVVCWKQKKRSVTLRHVSVSKTRRLFYFILFSRSLWPFYLERAADVLELLPGRYLSVDVVPRVARGDQDGAHVLVPTLQPEELLHQAHILFDGWGVHDYRVFCAQITNLT